MTTIEVLRTRGLPFSLMASTHGILTVCDGNSDELFSYCPHLGVMLGLGDFDDNPRMYTPKSFQLFAASVEDLVRMKRDWQQAANSNARYGKAEANRGQFSRDAPLPFIATLAEESLLPEEELQKEREEFDAICRMMEECLDESDHDHSA